MISVLDHLIGLRCLAYGTKQSPHNTIRLHSWHVRASSVTVSRNLLQIDRKFGKKNTPFNSCCGRCQVFGALTTGKEFKDRFYPKPWLFMIFCVQNGQGFTVRGVNQPRNKVMSCSTSPKVTMNHGLHRISTRHRCKGATCVNFQNIWIARNDLVLFGILVLHASLFWPNVFQPCKNQCCSQLALFWFLPQPNK